MSLQSLPQTVLGRIGDFLRPGDRESMRTLSGEFNTVFDSRARRSFTINQRLTMQDMQGGQRVSVNTREVLLSQRNFSTQLGTTPQLKRMLRETRLEETENRNGQWIRPLFRPQIVGGVQVPGPGLAALTTYRNNYFQEYIDWPEDCSNFIDSLMDYVFRENPTTFFNINYSLFTPEEIQAEIERRPNPFPLTLVKVKDFNLIDYAFKIRRIPGDEDDEYVAVKLNTVRELTNWALPDSPMATELFARYLGGNGDTLIEGLRPLLNYRYTHEIFIDIYDHDSDEGGGARVGVKRQRE